MLIVRTSEGPWKLFSDAQWELIPRVRDEWLAIGRETAPVNRAATIELLGRMYSAMGRPAPKNIVFLSSPLQVVVAINILQMADAPVAQQVSDEVHDEVCWTMEAKVFSYALDVVMDWADEEVVSLIRCRIATPVWQDLHFGLYDLIYRQLLKTTHGEYNRLMNWPFFYAYAKQEYSPALLDFFDRIGVPNPEIKPFIETAKYGGWMVLFWNWAFISARPDFIKRDDEGRLHSDSGPALCYPDGFSVNAIHGQPVTLTEESGLNASSNLVETKT